MEVLTKYMLLVIAVININWFTERETYVSCVPPADRSATNLARIFGKDNQPRPDFFQSIGRDTSSAKTYMMSLYKYTTENLNGEEFANRTVVEKADTVVSFVNHAYLPRPNASDEEGAMFFDVQTLENFIIESTLKSDLRIYLNATKKIVRDSSLKVTVFQIIIPKVKYELITSRVINASASMWHDFDILKASQSWKDDHSKNHGIIIVCSSLDKKVRTLTECGLVDFKGERDHRPFLVSFYQSGDEEEILAEQVPHRDERDENYQRVSFQERKRRSLETLFPHAHADALPPYSIPRKEHPNTTCGRHVLDIRFQDLGWSEWIIAPEGYKAAYCGGNCPFPLNDHTNASNHAIIQTLVHMILPSDIPQPCCAPIRLEPLRVLFLDEQENIVMKRYANMIVNDCGCQ